MATSDSITLQLPHDANLSGSFVARDELTDTFSEPGSLHYFDSRYDVYRTPDGEGGERFDVVVHHEPLATAPLYQLLAEVAPEKQNPGGIGGALADWEIVDSLSENEQARVKRHMRVKGFVDFLPSVHSFINVFLDNRRPSFAEYTNSHLQLEVDAHREIASLVVRMLCDGFPEAIPFFAVGEDAEKVKQFMFSAIAKDITRRSGRKVVASSQTTDELLRRYQSWGSSRRVDAMRHAFRSMGPTKREQIVNEFGALLLDPAEIDGEDYVYPRVELAKGYSLEQAYANRYPVQQGKYEAEVMDLVRPDGTKSVVMVRGSVRELDMPGPTMYPAISWTRNSDGNRTFNIERARSTVDDKPTTYVDGVLGVLAVAYLQPKSRQDWETTQGYRGSSYDQNIGVAQVPVLVLQPDRKEELFNGDFVEAVESV
jgi:hypothetical protein